MRLLRTGESDATEKCTARRRASKEESSASAPGATRVGDVAELGAELPKAPGAVARVMDAHCGREDVHEAEETEADDEQHAQLGGEVAGPEGDELRGAEDRNGGDAGGGEVRQVERR